MDAVDEAVRCKVNDTILGETLVVCGSTTGLKVERTKALGCRHERQNRVGFLARMREARHRGPVDAGIAGGTHPIGLRPRVTRAGRSRTRPRAQGLDPRIHWIEHGVGEDGEHMSWRRAVGLILSQNGQRRRRREANDLVFGYKRRSSTRYWQHSERYELQRAIGDDDEALAAYDRGDGIDQQMAQRALGPSQPTIGGVDSRLARGERFRRNLAISGGQRVVRTTGDRFAIIAFW